MDLARREVTVQGTTVVAPQPSAVHHKLAWYLQQLKEVLQKYWIWKVLKAHNYSFKQMKYC